MKYQVEQNLSYTCVEADNVCITPMNNLEFSSGGKLVAAFANGQWVSFSASPEPESEQGSQVGHYYTEADEPKAD